MRFLLPAVVLAGIALRLRQFVVWRSLWIDEAMLALNVVSRSFQGLLLPLDYNQGAPVGFLVLQKLASLPLGDTDTAMRVVPLLASCAAVALFARVATTWAGGAGVVAAALFAVATPLVQYAVEAKPYPVDVAATVALLAALGPWVAARGPATRDWALLAGVGALAPWLSHPAAFVLPGAGLVVLWRSVRQGRAALLRVAVVAAVWSVSFALLYGLSLRTLASNAVLTGYWRTSFAPFGRADLWAWAQGMTGAYLRDVAAVGDGAAAWLVVAAGLVSLVIRRRADLAVALVAPLVLAFAASGLRLYPFSGRMLLFAVPTTLLLCAEALACASRVAGSIAGYFAGDCAAATARCGVLVLSAVVLLGSPLAGAWALVQRPRNPEALRPALEYMLSRREDGEAIYVYYGAKPAVNFYVRSLPIPMQALVQGRAHRDDPEAYRNEVRQVLAQPGAWVVLSHNCPGCRVDEWQVVLDELDAHGRRVDSFVGVGAEVHHYRFGPAGNSERGS